MKYLLITTSSRSVLNFRVSFIKMLLEKGNEVVVVSLDDEMKEDIEKLNVKFYSVSGSNRSLNPFKMFSSLKEYRNIIKLEKPDCVLTYQLKPNIFGVVAAKKERINNIYPMVEGLGDTFFYNTFKWKLIRLVVCFLYKRACKNARKVFFLNNDDKNEFIRRKIAEEEQCVIINGIGVDTSKFEYKPIKNYNSFLMVARMLKTKGVMEYCKAAREVKKEYPDVMFNYLGAEGDIKLSDIQEYIDDGSINYLGLVKDVRPYLEECSVFVLPSYYREGLPMSIMEAMSLGRGIITTNNVGCKETVVEGYNGNLINTNNIEDDLKNKILECVDNKEIIERFSKNSRNLALERFEQKKINEKIYKIID